MQHISSLPVIWSNFSAVFFSLELHQAFTQSCVRCLQGLTACNIRCKATGSRTDVLPQSINSFWSHRHATRERRSMPLNSIDMQRWFKIFAVVTAVGLVLFGGAYAFMRQPSLFTWRYELRIATGPIGSDGQKILAAFIREVAAERPIVRLVPVPADSLSASGKALIEGQVDLAVVRSDDAAAAQGRTVFILRRIGLAIVLPPESKIESVSELSGKKLAVIKAAHFDPALLKAFTSFYGLRDSDLVELTLPEVGPAMKAKRVVAALVFGPIGAGTISDAFAAVRKSFKDKPSYLDIEEAEAIAARWPAYEAVEIKQGTFGGTPPEPAEAINTFAVSVRLVTRASLPDRVAGEVTRLLLSTKAKLASTLPVVGEMQAPAGSHRGENCGGVPRDVCSCFG